MFKPYSHLSTFFMNIELWSVLFDLRDSCAINIKKISWLRDNVNRKIGDLRVRSSALNMQAGSGEGIELMLAVNAYTLLAGARPKLEVDQSPKDRLISSQGKWPSISRKFRLTAKANPWYNRDRIG